MTEYYNKKGVLINADRWSDLYNNHKYRTIAEETLNNKLIVRTQWVGFDYSYSGYTPRVFESIVFSNKGVDYQRYSSLKEAKLGHKMLISRWES